MSISTGLGLHKPTHPLSVFCFLPFEPYKLSLFPLTPVEHIDFSGSAAPFLYCRGNREEFQPQGILVKIKLKLSTTYRRGSFLGLSLCMCNTSQYESVQFFFIFCRSHPQPTHCLLQVHGYIKVETGCFSKIISLASFLFFHKVCVCV